MIRLTDIKKVYVGKSYQTEALKGINLCIEENDFVAVMGESGSGKTTLLNIIGGMDMPTEGEYYYQDIAMHNQPLNKLQAIRKNHISFIFQHFALMDKYSVFENIELPLLAKNVKRSERKSRVKKIMEELGIGELEKKLPAEISGGQQQRVALARAFVSENELILADEPTGAIDNDNSRKVMEILKRKNKEGKTIVIVTHDKNMADYCDKIIKIQDGHICE